MKEIIMVILATLALSPFLPFVGMIIGFLMIILATLSPAILGLFYGFDRLKKKIAP